MRRKKSSNNSNNFRLAGDHHAIVRPPGKLAVTPAMGRPRKTPTTVTISMKEIDLLVSKLGYSQRQDLLDDPAMSDVSKIVKSTAPPKPRLPEKGSGKVIPTPQSKPVEGGKRLSWVDLVKEEENPKLKETLADQEVVESSKRPEPMNDLKEKAAKPPAPPAALTTPWADIVKGNRSVGNGMNLEYISNNGEAVISNDEWEEGANLWRHPLV